MNCNCSKGCPIPFCITELEVGIIEPGLTGLVIEFKDIITGRIKKLTGIAPQSDGLLVVDVEDINAFFSPNFSYELKVLFSDESECEIVPITIGDQTVDCISFNFADGEATKGILVLENQYSQYLYLTGNFNTTLTFTLTFSSGSFIMYWGDGTESRIYSGQSTTHTYLASGAYTAKIRGDFSKATSISTGNAGTHLNNVVMPPTNLFTNIVLRSNNLTVAAVNNLLVNVDGQGLTGGLITIQNQSPVAAPTFQGAAAKTNLTGKGWSVTTD